MVLDVSRGASHGRVWQGRHAYASPGMGAKEMAQKAHAGLAMMSSSRWGMAASARVPRGVTAAVKCRRAASSGLSTSVRTVKAGPDSSGAFRARRVRPVSAARVRRCMSVRPPTPIRCRSRRERSDAATWKTASDAKLSNSSRVRSWSLRRRPRQGV